MSSSSAFAAAVPLDDLQIPGFTLKLTSAHMPLIDEVKRMHETLIAPTFSENETEEVELFVERLEVQQQHVALGLWGSPKEVIKAAAVGAASAAAEGEDKNEKGTEVPQQVIPDWEFYVAMLIDDATQHVVGAAVHEVYLRSGCALVSYLVVSETMRGKGVAGKLMEAAFRNCTQVMLERGPEVGCDGNDGKVLHAMFIEVLQVRDDDVSAADPSNTAGSIVRQAVFKKLRFVALDMDLVHPGRMKGHRYNLSLRSDIHSTQFPVKVLLTFMTDLFAGILADEGVQDETDINEYRRDRKSVV